MKKLLLSMLAITFISHAFAIIGDTPYTQAMNDTEVSSTEIANDSLLKYDNGQIFSTLPTTMQPFANATVGIKTIGYVCTGTVISPKQNVYEILTAAHCLAPLNNQIGSVSNIKLTFYNKGKRDQVTLLNASLGNNSDYTVATDPHYISTSNVKKNDIGVLRFTDKGIQDMTSQNVSQDLMEYLAIPTSAIGGDIQISSNAIAYDFASGNATDRYMHVGNFYGLGWGSQKDFNYAKLTVTPSQVSTITTTPHLVFDSDNYKTDSVTFGSGIIMEYIDPKFTPQPGDSGGLMVFCGSMGCNGIAVLSGVTADKGFSYGNLVSDINNIK